MMNHTIRIRSVIQSSKATLAVSRPGKKENEFSFPWSTRLPNTFVFVRLSLTGIVKYRVPPCV